MTGFRWALGAPIVAGLMLVGAAAHSQQKAPDKAPAPKAAPKAKSACNQITDEAKCKGDATCSWIAALMDAAGKQKRKAYCKTKPKPPAKKAKEAPKK